MQAHGRQGAEAVHQEGRGGRHVVAKAVVDQATQRAALLLADSSCLLVTLAGTSAVVPITVPPPCSDACFLRLQAYGLAGASSSPSGIGHKFGNGLSPSSSRVGFGGVVESGALKIGQGESHVSGVQEPRENESSGNFSSGNNRAMAQVFEGARMEFFVITTRPAQGGSCTDLSAWSCADPAFACADIELGESWRSSRGGLHIFPSGSAHARLDAPHGLAVRTVASTNVLVVYSSSAGKLWVIAGKLLDQGRGPALTVMVKDELEAEGPYKKRLLLMKRAVVRCHGPVYSIHVSPLHLFLGENKGVRVWSLRPLIKPGSTGNSSGQSKLRLPVATEHGSNQSSHTPDCERCGGGDRSQPLLESSSASGRTPGNTSVSNGAYLDSIVDLKYSLGVASMKRLQRKGLLSTGDLDPSANSAGIGNYRKPPFGSGGLSRISNSEFWNLSELRKTLKSRSGSDHLSDNTTSRAMMGIGGGMIDNETGTSVSPNFSAENGGVPMKEILSAIEPYGSLGDSITESAETVSSDECTGNYPLKTAPRPRSGLIPVVGSLSEGSQLGVQPVTSHLVRKVLRQFGPSVPAMRRRAQSNLNLDAAGMWFVALSGTEGVVTTQCTSHAGPRSSPQLQVVDMQGLSLKEHVVLDSEGELYLLTLHEVSEGRKLVSLGCSFPTLRHLQNTMRVTSFAVLPPIPPFCRAHRDFVSPAAMTAVRRLWVSDGMCSIHIVVLPEEKHEGCTDSTQTGATFTGSQAVFTKDRVDVLVSGSPDTVVVLTKGKLVSYVVPGGLARHSNMVVGFS